MNILFTLLQICLLRGKPQDLPTSMTLVIIAAVFGVIVDLFSLPAEQFAIRSLAFVLLQTVLFGFGIWIVLRTKGLVARWMQTATALFAVNAMFSLLILPLTPALHQMLQSTTPVDPGWPGIAAFLLSSWFLAVVALVLREALEVGLLLSFAIALALMFGVFIVGSMFAAILGLYPQA